MLKIYPTTKSIKEEYLKYKNKNTTLPKIITIDEFKKKSLFYGELLDEDSRVLYLREASDFEEFKRLKFDREFFSFFKNGHYLLNFFEKLACELVDIDKLLDFNPYKNYKEDINSLKKLLINYKNILNKQNKFDKIFLPKEAILNENYIKSFEDIELFLEGYLSNFEFHLFLKISKITKLIINLKINQFNKNIIKYFNHLDISLDLNYQYLINLSTKQIILKKPIVKNSNEIEINHFENRILQVSNIKRKIYDFIVKKIPLNKIAIILPNDDFVDILKNYDEENYFNFTMGFSFKNSKSYKQLSAISEYLEDKNYQNKYRISRLNVANETMMNKLNLLWNNEVDKNSFENIFDELLKELSIEEEEIKKEIFLFSKFLSNKEKFVFNRLFHLFLSRLSKRKIKDINSAKIDVIRPIDAISRDLEAVIIVDFNENFVPKKFQKELFISSSIKNKLSIPTLEDEENLEKYYYYSLIFSSKNVVISYTLNEENNPSILLDELKLEKNKKTINQNKIIEILYQNNKKNNHYQIEDLYEEFDFSQVKLSSTMLKSFLDCKRKFYFQYIKKLKFEEIPQENILDARNIGILLHHSLALVYKKQNRYFDEKLLFEEIKNSLYQNINQNLYLKYQIDIWIKNFSSFVKNEIKRFQEGYKVLEVEKVFYKKYKNFILKGIVDRIDIKDDKIDIIDYKSGKVPSIPKDLSKISDFQLEFYYHLLVDNFEINDIYYYDLSNTILISWQDGKKLNLFDEVLESLLQKKFNFVKTNKIEKCRYCNYSLICNR